MAYEFVMNRRRTALFAILWLGATYVIWIPITLVTDRAMYMFYFLPSVGAVCLAIAFGAQRVWQVSKTTKRKAARWLVKGLVVSVAYRKLCRLVEKRQGRILSVRKK
jgi:4-hydroxybenzoate polyprenyltransferase